MLEDEYQQQVVELEEDLDRVKKAIDKQAREKNAFDRQSMNTIKKLTGENQRLGTKLNQAQENEKNLASRKNAFNTRIVGKKTSIQEHYTIMEELNKKISKIILIKGALETQLKDVKIQNENKTNSVGNSLTKVRQLEQKTKMQEIESRNLEKDCEKFKLENQYVLGQLEKV